MSQGLSEATLGWTWKSDRLHELWHTVLITVLYMETKPRFLAQV
jgi:hypothetical protein